MKISISFFLLLSLMLFSCSKPVDGLQKQAGGDQATPPAVDGQLGGTSSNGGGNGIKGKLLESYIVRDLAQKIYYSSYITPLVEKLSSEYPYLAADILYITNERDWYFVPAELDQISKNVLGTYALSDQYALQDLNKIWINSLLFDKMQNDAEKATLIIHEIVMGVRLMQFKNKQDQCIAKAARILLSNSTQANGSDANIDKLKSDTKKQLGYADKKAECRETYPLIMGVQNQRFELVNEDYDLIRKIVSLLVAEKLDVKEIKSLIEANHFRSYED